MARNWKAGWKKCCPMPTMPPQTESCRKTRSGSCSGYRRKERSQTGPDGPFRSQMSACPAISKTGLLLCRTKLPSDISRLVRAVSDFLPCPAGRPGRACLRQAPTPSLSNGRCNTEQPMIIPVGAVQNFFPWQNVARAARLLLSVRTAHCSLVGACFLPMRPESAAACPA